MTDKLSYSVLCRALVAGLFAMAPLGAAAQHATAPLSLTAARVTIHGSSNIGGFSATTTDVDVMKLSLAPGVSGLNAAAPGAVEAFEIVIRAASLSSPIAGLDPDLHQALKVSEYPDIMFRLLRLAAKPAAAAGTLRAVGVLEIAGVEQEIAFDLRSAVTGATLTISGDVPLVMTDFGIAPRTSMLGLVKADTRIVVKFDTIMAIPTTF